MAVDVASLLDHGRLLLEADLIPLQGERFQPTGFPDLGAATYMLPDGTEMLLVESAQSTANRLENVIWDDGADELVEPLRGLPYVRVRLGENGTETTTSILEAHRLHSAYIRDATDGEHTFLERLQDELGGMEEGPVDLRRVAEVAFRYDPNSVLHGVFFADKGLAAGRLSLQRLLSGYIEARDVQPVESGGVKKDRVNPRQASGGAERGFGHVPFHRTEYVADTITGYFNLDLDQLTAYDLGRDAEELLVGLGLYKIRRFLNSGLRLRTACDLDCTALTVTRPSEVELPTEQELAAALPERIERCAQGGLFHDPPVLELEWNG